MSKRVEIYLGFKCNNNCVFCVEKNNRQKYQANQYYQNLPEIEAKILDLQKQGYDHINFLGGEPFLEKNFLPFLQAAKKHSFNVAVTTNGSFLADDKIAGSHLPLIDDLIVSIHGHNQELVDKQSNSPGLFQKLLLAFGNIKKYFSGRLLKANCVINKLNYHELDKIVEFISQKGIKEISLTNMSIKGFNNDYAVRLVDLKPVIKKVVDSAQKNNVLLRFSDLPFCVLEDNYILANELYADSRQKFNINNEKEEFWRPKIKPAKCADCRLKDLCLGLDMEYYKLFGDGELEPVI